MRADDAVVMAALRHWHPKVVERPTPNTSARLVYPIGPMGHYDASAGSDASAVGWFFHPKCDVSYDVLSTDDGTALVLNPRMISRCTWHGGVGLVEAGVPTQRLTKRGTGASAVPLPSPFPYGASNHGYIGTSVTTGGDPDGVRGPKQPAQVTVAQAASFVLVWCAIVEALALHLASLERTCVGHEDRAIYNPKNNPTLPDRWGQLGRKSDPTGDTPARPILSTAGVRTAVRLCLTDPAVAADHRAWVLAGA